jgi:hypothetical protein
MSLFNGCSTAYATTRRTRRRCLADVPPQTPVNMTSAAAKLRHSSVTRHPAQMARAASSFSPRSAKVRAVRFRDFAMAPRSGLTRTSLTPTASVGSGLDQAIGALLDLDRLQRQHSVCRLSSVERPPLETGTM